MHFKPPLSLPTWVRTHGEGLPTYDNQIENLRKDEYPLLQEQTYLDHAGTTLYAKTLVERFSKDLTSNIYGNPHSGSNPAALSATCVDRIRERALRFFNASPKDFDLIFVANATAAVKLVADAFQDASSDPRSPDGSPGFWYGWHRDAHSSIVGLREVTNGFHHCFHSDDDVQRWINDGCSGHEGFLGLFAFPGQSNMTGRRLPLTWPGQIRETETPNSDRQKIYTLLDAAALCTTRALDFSDPSSAPDFTVLSFYKIFGFPDLGALIVRKPAGHVLDQRRYFGGGTVDMVISLSATWHAKKASTIHESVEDGTLPFHSILALGHALDVHAQLFGSMQQISTHTAHLVRLLHDQLVNLRHANGAPVCHIYNDASARYGDPLTQGATVALNIRRADGAFVGYEDVAHAANEHRIYVRSGSLCNPGGMAHYLAWSPAEMRAAFENGHRCSDPIQLVDGRPTGVVRVSLGAMSTKSDVTRWVGFVQETYVERGGAAGEGGKVDKVGADGLHGAAVVPSTSPDLAPLVVHGSQEKAPVVGMQALETPRLAKPKWRNCIRLSRWSDRH